MLSVSNARDNLGRNRDTLEGPYTAPSSALFSYIKQETEPDSTLIFFKPRVLRMLTGRKAYSTRDTDQYRHGDYLVTYLRGDNRQLPLEEIEYFVEREAIEIMYENDDFRVYRLKATRDVMPALD